MPSEEDSKKSNSYKNAYAVSTEESKKAISENMEALRTEDGAKDSRSDNKMPVLTE